MSYNILAEDFFNDPRKSKDSFFNFKNRSKCVLATIAQANPDICILQEVDQLNFYLPEFTKLGYGFAHNTRVEGPDAVVILFKLSKFTKIKEVPLNFNEGHPFVDEDQYKKNNVGVCVDLIHRETHKKVVVLGLHLHWDPKFEQVKYLQTLMALDYLEANYTGDEVIFWGGDFNSKPEDNSIKYVFSRQEPEAKNPELNDDQVSKILEDEGKIYKFYHGLTEYTEFGNLYANYGKATGQSELFPAFTNYKSYFKATLDHIFYKKASAVPVKLLKIDEEGIKKNYNLPAIGYPSDHVPIMGVFLIVPEAETALEAAKTIPWHVQSTERNLELCKFERKIIIKNLKLETSCKDLSNVLSRYGKIEKISFETCESKDQKLEAILAYVLFDKEETAKEVLSKSQEILNELSSFAITKVELFRNQPNNANAQHSNSQQNKKVPATVSNNQRPQSVEKKVDVETPQTSHQKVSSFHIGNLRARMNELMALDDEKRRMVFGEVLYPKVLQKTSSSVAPKLTGMLIDLDMYDIMEMIEKPSVFDERIQEGLEILRDVTAQ